jgi:hypothetical protein
MSVDATTTSNVSTVYRNHAGDTSAELSRLYVINTPGKALPTTIEEARVRAQDPSPEATVRIAVGVPRLRCQ